MEKAKLLIAALEGLQLDPAMISGNYEEIAGQIKKADPNDETGFAKNQAAQGRTDPNAAICYLPGEAHLIFTGPILTLLSAMELRAVIGHELAHYLLWQIEDGAYYLADRILHQSAAHAQAESSHIQSARLWSLATELFADRGSYQATGCLETDVASLV